VDFKEENFPVYQLLVSLGLPDAERATADFEKARTGGDEEKYKFAMGILAVASTPDCLPGQTAEMNKKTLQSCRAVFEDVASRGHVNAALVVKYFIENGLGAPDMPPKTTGTFSPKPKSFDL